MSALKDYSYNEDEDGQLPSLVTGTESNITEILQNIKTNGGTVVSSQKLERANKQVEEAELLQANAQNATKIPVTVITGYLGSGKSTLLEMIATKNNGMKIAVILNEFGDSSEIEKAMTIKNGSASYQEWLDLGNGCLCCSLKNVGVKAIEDMVSRSPGSIDYILLETSGIADPAPIAKMFWQDEGLNSSVYIDGIITVLDAENVLQCLDDKSPKTHWHGEKVMIEDNLTVAHFQIAMADKILLNKVDRIPDDKESRDKIEDRIRQINAFAPIYPTKYGDAPLNLLLDIHAYDSEGQTFKDNQLFNRPVLHDSRMNTVTLSFRKLHSEQEFIKFEQQFLQVLLWRNFGVNHDGDCASISDNADWEIQRTKGLILFQDQTTTKVIQGVRETYDVFPGQQQQSTTQCKLVFIGKYLNQTKIQHLLDRLLN